MNRDSSDEYAGRAPLPKPAAERTFALGDRVEVRETGKVGTVRYANNSSRGYFVTVKVDGIAKPVTFLAGKLRRVETLF